MADGYENAGESDFPDLDEWLCEYVDGTIDPVVREAPEEYMQVNPALAAHVERLRHARQLLCYYGCRHRAPKSLQPRLQRRLATEIIQDVRPFVASVSVPFISIAAISSLVAIFLIVASAEAPAPRFYTAQLRNTPAQLGVAPMAHPVRATPLRSLTTNRYYSRFAGTRSVTVYDPGPSAAILLQDPSDTASTYPPAPALAFP